jgi:hypothetical protein
MHRNDHLYAMVATGYYDLNTTPAEARHTTEQAGIPKDRLVLEALEAGHEPYVEPAVAARLAQDIRKFVKSAVP